MRHRVAGKQLSRNTSHRRALRRNMASALLEHGTIRTTVVKAKELRSFVEKLITTARQGTLHARRQVVSLLQDRAILDEDTDSVVEARRAGKTVIAKLFNEIAPRYADRPGGYTRIIHLPERRIGDAGKQVLLQLVEQTAPAAESEAAAPVSRRRRRAARRAEAAKTAGEQPAAKAPAEQPPAQEPAEGQAGGEAPAAEQGQEGGEK